MHPFSGNRVLRGLAIGVVSLTLWHQGALAQGQGNGNNPGGPVRPVEVVNDTLNIEGAVSLDVPDAERFQISTVINIAEGQAFASAFLNIPPGKRLLVDFVSADVRLFDGQRGLVRLSLGPATPSVGGDAGAFVRYDFPLVDSDSRISTASNVRPWFLSQQVDLWADTSAAITLIRGSDLDGPIPGTNGAAAGTVRLSGRIVDIP